MKQRTLEKIVKLAATGVIVAGSVIGGYFLLAHKKEELPKFESIGAFDFIRVTYTPDKLEGGISLIKDEEGNAFVLYITRNNLHCIRGRYVSIKNKNVSPEQVIFKDEYGGHIVSDIFFDLKEKKYFLIHQSSYRDEQTDEHIYEGRVLQFLVELDNGVLKTKKIVDFLKDGSLGRLIKLVNEGIVVFGFSESENICKEYLFPTWPPPETPYRFGDKYLLSNYPMEIQKSVKEQIYEYDTPERNKVQQELEGKVNLILNYQWGDQNHVIGRRLKNDGKSYYKDIVFGFRRDAKLGNQYKKRGEKCD